MNIPNYTGTITLLVGILIVLLKAFGWEMPEAFKGQAIDAITAIITAATMAVGVWRLLKTKQAADKLSDQVLARGGIPVAGSAKGQLPAATTQAPVTGKPFSQDMQSFADVGASGGVGQAAGGGSSGKRVFSALRRPLPLLGLLAALTLPLGGAACPAQVAAWFGGTPTPEVKSTLAEVYGDACRAYDAAEHFAAQAINQDLMTRAQVDAVGAAQRIGTPMCTGPLPVNVAQALVQLGQATLQISSAIAASKAATP